MPSRADVQALIDWVDQPSPHYTLERVLDVVVEKNFPGEAPSDYFYGKLRQVGTGAHSGFRGTAFYPGGSWVTVGLILDETEIDVVLDWTFNNITETLESPNVWDDGPGKALLAFGTTHGYVVLLHLSEGFRLVTPEGDRTVAVLDGVHAQVKGPKIKFGDTSKPVRISLGVGSG